MTAWGKWWFINGGSFHAMWKQRKYRAIRDLALKLPQMAWDAAVDQFKVHGTDGCTSCETGRVTMYVTSTKCVSCDVTEPTKLSQVSSSEKKS